MKIVVNNVIPFKGFAAINLFGMLFVKQDAVISEKMINHEQIHTEQGMELQQQVQQQNLRLPLI